VKEIGGKKNERKDENSELLANEEEKRYIFSYGMGRRGDVILLSV
jgi:hypothetical protein